MQLLQDRASVSREFRKMEPGRLDLDLSRGLAGGGSGGVSGGLVEAGVAALCALLRSND